MELPIKIELPEGFLNKEERCGYVISSKMKAVWAVELDLLIRFDKLCKENRIEYMACGGTILGAIRHGGFIPWDDDLDVMMTRENYNKLCNLDFTKLEPPYFFQTEYSDPGSIRGHAQFRNVETTAVLNTEMDKRFSFCQGVFIDILPLDNFPDRAEDLAKIRKIQKTYSKRCGQFARLTSRYYKNNDNSIKEKLLNVVGFGMSYISKKINCQNPWYKKLEKTYQSFNLDETSYIGIFCLSGENERYVWRQEDLQDSCLVPFEFINIPIPTHYENVLTKTYNNWKEFVVDQSFHGEIFFDTEHSYREYINGEREFKINM